MYKYNNFDEYWKEFGTGIDNASICGAFKLGLKELVKHGFDSAREVNIPSKEEVEEGLKILKDDLLIKGIWKNT